MSLSHDPGDALKQALLAALAEGRFAPGERLPPERALAALHQLGRARVRRVLGELATAGLVSRAIGSGTYVARDIAARLPDSATDPGVSPAELMDARLIFEPALIERANSHATTADLAALEACCREGEAAADLARFEYWDDAFHRALAAAAHNGFVARVFALISQSRDAAEWGVLKQRSALPERRVVYMQEHRAILAGLRARDATQARAALVAHLRHVQRNMFGA